MVLNAISPDLTTCSRVARGRNSANPLIDETSNSRTIQGIRVPSGIQKITNLLSNFLGYKINDSDTVRHLANLNVYDWGPIATNSPMEKSDFLNFTNYLYPGARNNRSQNATASNSVDLAVGYIMGRTPYEELIKDPTKRDRVYHDTGSYRDQARELKRIIKADGLVLLDARAFGDNFELFRNSMTEQRFNSIQLDQNFYIFSKLGPVHTRAKIQSLFHMGNSSTIKTPTYAYAVHRIKDTKQKQPDFVAYERRIKSQLQSINEQNTTGDRLTIKNRFNANDSGQPTVLLLPENHYMEGNNLIEQMRSMYARSNKYRLIEALIAQFGIQNLPVEGLTLPNRPASEVPEVLFDETGKPTPATKELLKTMDESRLIKEVDQGVNLIGVEKPEHYFCGIYTYRFLEQIDLASLDLQNQQTEITEAQGAIQYLDQNIAAYINFSENSQEAVKLLNRVQENIIEKLGLNDQEIECNEAENGLKSYKLKTDQIEPERLSAIKQASSLINQQSFSERTNDAIDFLANMGPGLVPYTHGKAHCEMIEEALRARGISFIRVEPDGL